jgi:hypothetical protein
MGRSRWFLVALWLGAVACAVGGPEEGEEGRVAAPLALASGLERAFREAGLPLRAVPLRPQERAKDLEVLLLSSGSTAYDAYVVRATSLPLLEPWLAPVPAAVSSWREDVAAALRAGRGDLSAGLPLSCDGPVLLLRQGAAPDWGEGSGPEGLAEFENALEKAENRDRRPVRLWTTLPPAVLLLSLAWSEEGGKGGPGLPEGPAARAVAFLQRRFLGSPASSEEAKSALLGGQAEGLFCWASEADALVARGGLQGVALTVRPLPHHGSTAMAPFGGWTLVWPAEGAGEGRRQAVLRRQRSLEEALGRAGFVSVTRAPNSSPSPGSAALLATRFRDLPFSAAELEILDQAVADAVEAGIAPEQVLRRARARLAGERRAFP